jgi:GntR family transcriptional regulator of vanillate catabolism
MTDKIDRTNLDAKVYNTVKDMILSRRLEPGQQIIQDQLADELGVSRTPVRRALIQLEEENLVVTTSRGQTFVRSFDKKEMISVYEIRAVLEGLACRLLAQKATGDQISALKGFFPDVPDRNPAEPAPHDDYLRADREFHATLPRMAGDPLLNNVLSTFHILYATITHGLLRPPAETRREHLDIIRALESGNSELAETLARGHIRKSIETIKELM